jgi:CubicO group peptidase (beta-lactamase class C family)
MIILMITNFGYTYDPIIIQQLFDTTFTNQSMQSNSISSVSISFIHMNQSIFEKGYGYIDPITSSKPVTASDTIYAIGEITSVFTVHAFMHLYTSKKYSVFENITLDTPIDIVLKKLKSPVRIENDIAGKWSGFPRSTGKSISLRHLLEQTSGFDGEKRSTKNFVLKESQLHANLQSFIIQIEAPRVWPVESFATFDDFNVCMLAYIVELVTGAPYEKYAQSLLNSTMDTSSVYLKYSETLANLTNFAYPISHDGKQLQNFPMYSNTPPTNSIFTTASSLGAIGNTIMHQTGEMRSAIEHQFSNMKTEPGRTLSSRGFVWHRNRVVTSNNVTVDYAFIGGDYGPYTARLVLLPEQDVVFSMISIGMSFTYSLDIVNKLIDAVILDTPLIRFKTIKIADLSSQNYKLGKQYVGCYVNASYEHTTPNTFFQIGTQPALCLEAGAKYMTASVYKRNTHLVPSTLLLAQIDPVNQPNMWYEGTLIPNEKSIQFSTDHFWSFGKNSKGEQFLFSSRREDVIFEYNSFYKWFSVTSFSYAFIGIESFFAGISLAMFIFLGCELYAQRKALNLNQKDLLHFLVDAHEEVESEDLRTEDYLENIYDGVHTDSFDILEPEMEEEKPQNFLQAALRRFKPNEQKQIRSDRKPNGISRRKTTKGKSKVKIQSKSRLFQIAVTTMVVQFFLATTSIIHIIHILGMVAHIQWMLFLPYISFVLFPLMVLTLPLFIFARIRMGNSYYSAIGWITIVLFVLCILTNLVYYVFIFRLHWLSTKLTLGLTVK